MSVPVELPVFVSVAPGGDPRRKYRVRALFVPTLEGRGRTFDRALRACAKAVRNCFRGREVVRDSVEDVLWAAFTPELQVHRLEVELPAPGGGLMPLQILIARFELHGVPYVCVPRLDGHVVRLPPDARWPAQVEALERDLRRYVRRLRKQAHPDPLRLEPFAFQKGDFVTTLTAHLPLTRGRFAFEPPLGGDRFASASEAEVYHGASELPGVATELSERFPDELKRTLGDDGRVDELSAAIYEGPPAAIVLLGPPGAGRTTLLHEAIARRMEAHERVGGVLARLPRVWHLDPTRMVSGMAIIGAWQRRAQAILVHLRDRLRQHHQVALADALYVDNPVALCHVGRHAGGDLTLSAVLRPFVERREIPVILEASPEAWQRLKELDRPFADLFRVIRVPPPPRRDALRMLIAHRAAVERTSGSTITRSALARVVQIDERFTGGRARPGSFVDRLSRLADQHPGQTITEAEVQAAFLQRSGLRPHMLDAREAWPADALEDALSRQLVGQPSAVRAMTEVLQRLRAAVHPLGRPAASLLLVGPTGVGKTETAKVLAHALYDDPQALVRFDMNEYVDGGAAARLIGDGVTTEGQLTGRLRHRRFCVLLLDEIEKAHPSVHDLLLQVLDEGRLTDALGRTVDFSQAVIVLTSNIGAREASVRLGFEAGDGAEHLAATYRAALRRAFRPEFLNRIDQVVVFGRLSAPDIERIARLQIARLLRREGLLRRTLIVQLDPSVLPWVSTLGFDPELGARALKRALERHLLGPLAEAVVPLAVDQPTVVAVSVREGSLAIQTTPLAPRAAEAASPLAPLTEAGDPRAAAAWLLPRVDDALDTLERTGGGVAVASPEGVAEAPAAMVLRSRLRALRARLLDAADEDDELDYDVGGTGAARSLRPFNPRMRRQGRRSRWPCPPTQQEKLLHEHVREVVQELMTTPAVASDVLSLGELTLSEAWFQLRAAALVGGPPYADVLVRNLSSGVPDAWSLYAPLLAGWQAVTDRLGGSVERRGPADDDALDRHLVVHGVGMAALWAQEAGVHLFYPQGEPPRALLVRVEPREGPVPPTLEGLGARLAFGEGAPPQAVRLYCPPDPVGAGAGVGPPGSITDLVSGSVVPWGQLDAWLQDWMVRGL